MEYKTIHLVAPKFFEGLKNDIEAIDYYTETHKFGDIEEKKDIDVKLKVTFHEYSFTGLAHWSTIEDKGVIPDIILIFDTAEYVTIDLSSGRNVGYANMINCLKIAKINLPEQKFVILLAKDKEDNLEFLNELIKLNIQNFYFLDSEFKIDDIKRFLFSNKTLKDNEKYITTSSVQPISMGTPNKAILTFDNNSSKEKVTIVEKEVVIKEEVIKKELDSAVMAIYAARPTGKSFISWNLSQCFSSRDYNTTLINVDEGHSANIYFGIDDIYFEVIDRLTDKNMTKDIFEYCYKRNKINVLARALGEQSQISLEKFEKLLFYCRAKSNIVLVDCRSGLDDITKHAIKNSTLDLLVFDSDLMHYHMNKLLIDELGDSFVPEKTIAIINNCNTKSEAYKFIHKQIRKMGYEFKDIMPISSCFGLGCEGMNTDKTAYQLANSEYPEFVSDMDKLLELINSREVKTGLLTNILNKLKK